MDIPMAAPSFDDRDGFIWFDGKLVDWRAAGIHVLTHGLHYGSCVFEGERVYNGKVFKLREHSQRLLDSARILGFEVPFSVEQIDQATLDTIKANNIVDGYVRPVAWRGSEMMGVAAQSSRIRVAIATWSWPSYWSPEARMRGIRLNMSEWKRPHPETAPTNAKAAGLYMICTMSKHKAEGDGYEDSLMLDWRGQVAEATGANIFFVYGNELHTPLPDCFLNGITRQTVIDLARARGIKVVERAIMPEEMINAAECFLTGTAAEVTPVREIGTYTFTPGEITRQLIADYDALVRS
ncbi:Branched-chain-amino-acid aminotransferase [Magnetospirillum sp. SS-4]|nr:Branched-chain-amino-acid aminotransferase [Magnetospirillum sp. SS-4]